MIAWLLLLVAIVALVAGTVLLWRAEAGTIPENAKSRAPTKGGATTTPRTEVRGERRVRTPPPTTTTTASYHRRRLPQQTFARRREATGAGDPPRGPS